VRVTECDATTVVDLEEERVLVGLMVSNPDTDTVCDVLRDSVGVVEVDQLTDDVAVVLQGGEGDALLDGERSTETVPVLVHVIVPLCVEESTMVGDVDIVKDQTREFVTDRDCDRDDECVAAADIDIELLTWNDGLWDTDLGTENVCVLVRSLDGDDDSDGVCE